MPLPDDVAALARAIAERHSVDWASAQASTSPEWRDAVHELRVIAEIAAFHGGTNNRALQTWGAFRILEPAGHGTYGHVYRAIDPRLDREVALKLMPPGDAAIESHTACIEEARLLARVRHPNVVTIYGADWIDGRVGLWMEFVQGRTLEQVLQHDGPLAPRDLAIVCRDVCRALDAVHEAGLLHRDIKAQNVMRDEGGRHVLMDFGAGRHAGRFSSPDLAGTPLYLAPELLDGEPASRQSDIYSVGVLLFRLATGRYPVEGSTLEELRNRHASGELLDLASLRPDYPNALVTLIERALSQRALDRFSTARAMAEDASRIVDSDQPQWKRRPLVWTAASVFVLATAIATVPRLAGEREATASGDVRARLLWDDATDLGGTTSADGRLLSFTDWSTASLAVRDLVSGRTTVLTNGRPGTSVERSAVSPDGRSVAYAWLDPSSARDDGSGAYELRVVSISGGDARALPMGPDVRYLEPHAWSPDGEWIAAAVARQGRRTIELVSRAGTARRVVATLPTWPGDTRFSPDGRWLAFHIEVDAAAVFLVRADGRTEHPTQIVAATTLLAWTRDGRLLFTREREGSAEVFALAMIEGRANGEPTKVGGMANLGRLVPYEVALGRGAPALGLTTAGALIYGQTRVATDAITVSIDPATGAIGEERVDRAVAAYGLNMLAGGVRYSPNGTQVLYTPTKGSVLIRASDGRARTIVPQLADVGRLEWAPDGRSLIIAGARSANERGVYRVDIDSGSASLLLDGTRPYAHALSPDGKTLFYGTGSEPLVTLVARDLRSGRERTLRSLDRTILQLKVSRDGRMLAVGTLWSVEILDLTSGDTLRRTNVPQGSKVGGGDWSPDGRSFFATVSHGDVHPRSELWRIPVAGGEPVKHSLTAPTRGGWMRADGREFSMMRTDQRSQVWAIENFLK
jgi:serine/threonine protein kinase/Tol biopolymer transport system component